MPVTDLLTAPPETVAAGAAPPPWRVAAAVARVEGPRLLRSPLVLVGFALNLAMTFGGPWVSNLRTDSADSGFVFLLGAAGTLIASNLATLRGRRHGTEELFGADPAPPGARTGGHLLAVAWPTALAVALLPVTVGAAVVLRDAFGRPDLADLAVGPLLVAGAGALGVLLARWAPSALAGPVACVGIAALELFLTSPAVLDDGLRWMAFWQGAGDIDLLPPRPSGWHAVYLMGLVAMAWVGALLRHGWRRPLVVAGATALAVVAGSTWMQAGTVTDEAWAARNRLLADPVATQVCQDGEAARYCYYPGYGPLVDRWSAVVEGVRRRVPEAAWLGATEVRQKFATQVYAPYDELSRVLPDLPRWDTPDPDDGRLRAGPPTGPPTSAWAWPWRRGPWASRWSPRRPRRCATRRGRAGPSWPCGWAPSPHPTPPAPSAAWPERHRQRSVVWPSCPLRRCRPRWAGAWTTWATPWTCWSARPTRCRRRWPGTGPS